MSLEKEWNKSLPSCLTCGWCPAYYEVEPYLEVDLDETNEKHNCYWSPCVSKDAEDPSDHKGYYLYVDKAPSAESPAKSRKDER